MRGALEQTAKILRESEYIVFLGGAWVPTAAQISNGLLIPIHGRAQAARGICKNSKTFSMVGYIIYIAFILIGGVQLTKQNCSITNFFGLILRQKCRISEVRVINS